MALSSYIHILTTFNSVKFLYCKLLYLGDMFRHYVRYKQELTNKRLPSKESN